MTDQKTGSHLPTPPDPSDEGDLLWVQLTDSFAWYDAAATHNRVAYQALKVFALAAGAVVTVLAATGARPVVTASLAGAVVVFEGVQQLFQFHPHWISYRTTAETLWLHSFAYAAKVPPYEDPANRRARLSRFLTDISSAENINWAKTMKDQSASPDASARKDET